MFVINYFFHLSWRETYILREYFLFYVGYFDLGIYMLHTILNNEYMLE